ncbi:MAG TPA: DUF1232 domain-containing protein [Longilinea sp.]|nr:DUF1232 domain-containing protein [Longilinea sp.]
MQKPDNQPNSVITSAAEKARSKAEDYLKDPEKSKQLLDEAIRKAKKQEKNPGPLAEIWLSVKALIRMMKAYFHHDYVNISWFTIATVVGAVIYFVLPFDLISDLIPFAGYIDDAAVIGFMSTQIKTDLNKFQIWEEEQTKIINL